MPLLFVIEDIFAIKERGVVAVGKLFDPQTAHYRINDLVEIHRRDGSIVHAVISGTPMGRCTAGKAEVLLRGLSGLKIARGDQVWVNTASGDSGGAADSDRTYLSLRDGVVFTPFRQ